RPGVPDVPSDDSEEELSWNSFDDEDVYEQTNGREESEGDKSDESDDGNDDDNDKTVKAGSDKDDEDNDDEEELAKNDDEDTESGSEDEGSDEEDQELRLSEEARIQKEEEVDELYRDVDINQGRGLQVTQNIEDSHVTLTLVHPDGPQESSSVSSFMTSMLNLISDAWVESIFTTASSPITGGLKDEENEGSMHQLALHLKQLPGVQADLPQGLNLDNCLPVSLLLQRNLCRLPVRWRNPHIWCLKQ
nr:hypothetical protein [Tanacetum cinerariifolium]